MSHLNQEIGGNFHILSLCGYMMVAVAWGWGVGLELGRRRAQRREGRNRASYAAGARGAPPPAPAAVTCPRGGVERLRGGARSIAHPTITRSPSSPSLIPETT